MRFQPTAPRFCQELLFVARADNDAGHGGALQEPVQRDLRHGLVRFRYSFGAVSFPGRETATICSEETGSIPARFFQEGDFGDGTAAVPPMVL